jgi:hypothetical protein
LIIVRVLSGPLHPTTGVALLILPARRATSAVALWPYPEQSLFFHTIFPIFCFCLDLGGGRLQENDRDHHDIGEKTQLAHIEIKTARHEQVVADAPRAAAAPMAMAFVKLISNRMKVQASI